MDIAIQFVPHLIIVALTFIPLWKLLRRVGLAPAWSALCILPLGFVIVIWMVAYRKWPAVGTDHAQGT